MTKKFRCGGFSVKIPYAMLIALAYVVVALLWEIYQERFYNTIAPLHSYAREAHAFIDVLVIIGMGFLLYYLIARAASIREK
ncbi:MAG TPA: hypothetical protein PLZ86_08365, partial [bacterium]|nr:hypothetical protein [bacterium]